MKLGITGATGQLGRIVISELTHRTASANIVALVRSPLKAADLGVEARAFDYSKPQEQAAALAGIDTLLLISGNEIGKRAEQHANVIAAAKTAGVKRIVYTSLLRADTSTLVLAGEHLATEEALKRSGIDYTILRNGWYTENYTPALPGILASGVVIGSSGSGKISAATRADYAAAAAVALVTEGHAHKTYELAGDEAFTMSDLAATISRLTGRQIPYSNIPVQEYAAALAGTGMPEGVAQFFAGTHVATEKGDLFDNGHALSTLIGRPTTPLAQTVADVLAHND